MAKINSCMLDTLVVRRCPRAEPHAHAMRDSEGVRCVFFVGAFTDPAVGRLYVVQWTDENPEV